MKDLMKMLEFTKNKLDSWSVHFLCIFLLGLLSTSTFASENNPYKDTPENHRIFSEALEFFNAPNEFDGFAEPALRAEFSRTVKILKQYKFEEVAEKVKVALLDEVVFLDDLLKQGDLKPGDIKMWFFVDALRVLENIGNSSDLYELRPTEKDHSPIGMISTELNKALSYINDQRKNNGGADFSEDQKNSIKDYAKIYEKLQKTLPYRPETRASAFDQERRLQLYLGKDFMPGADREAMVASVRLSNHESAAHRGVDWITEVRERMEKEAKGQPEAIEAFMRFEFERIFKPAREVPEVLWMLGIPGTGKDTHVHAYLDAIHGVQGAYKEHMLLLEPSRSTTDTWKHFGSNPGYVGSDKMSDLIRFLVAHSGGRYKIEKVRSFNSEVERVVETGTFDKKSGPSTGVLFINELHNWSRESIDVVLKKALERGTFPINNANGGVSSIEVPITIVIASNDGMGLVAPEGHVKGKSLSYDEVMKIWETNHRNYPKIRDAIKEKNEVRIGVKADRENGISPEVLNRIQDHGLVLMRPLMPQILLSIAQDHINRLAKRFSYAGHAIGRVNFVFSENVAKRIQEFGYNPEEGARYIKGNVVTLVETLLDQAIQSKQIGASEDPRDILVDIVTNDDNTWSLKLSFREMGTATVLQEDLLLPIKSTSIFAKKQPLSDEEIDKVLEFKKAFGERVVGAEHLSRKLQQALLAAENARHAGREDRALAFMFLGMSSTGKTQAAKEVAKFLHGAEDDLITIDFNGIVSESQVRELLFGFPNGPKSQFMKEYDRKGGKLVFLFDEIANVANPNILTPLYQLLREKTIAEFNDGKPRSMEGVTIIMTGNAGEEIYHGIPSNVPEKVRRAAAAVIYNNFVNSPLKQRAYLEKKFREAFLNRVGYGNTFFFSPLDIAPVRELFRIKLSTELKNLSDKNGRNYFVQFESEEELERTLDVFEKEGFHFKSQGQSIDDFVSQEFRQKIILLLQENKVPDSSEITIRYNRRSAKGRGADERFYEHFDLTVEQSGQKLELVLDGKIVEKEAKELYLDKIQTAYHEAGHEILRQALLQDLTSPDKISIIPGVTEIAGEYVYYAGVASHELHTKGAMTRKYVIARMAQLIAGGEAQRLINRGHVSEAGQSNDLERANMIAKLSILKYGLEPNWGFTAPTSNQSLQEYLSELSDEDSKKLKNLVGAYMKEAKALAHSVLAINYQAFMALGKELAIKGEVDQEQIKAVYEKHPVKDFWSLGRFERKAKVFNLPFLKTWALGLIPSSGRGLQTVSSIPKIPEQEIANIEDILEAKRVEEIKKARKLGNIKIKSAQGGCAELIQRAS